jgi:D-glycero-D-manno-heptose 1,7-bisphosphate phosphatase
MPFIVLDRDGVINHDSDEYIKSPEEWHAIPGSLEAIAQLNRSGYQVLVATNQSGVGRGYYDLETLNNIHEKLMIQLAAVGGYIDGIFFCPHRPDEHCLCRKPEVGLLYQMEEKFPINLAKTYFIGDSFADVQAAQKAGCMPLLVLTGKGQITLAAHPELSIPHFPNLAAAVDYVVFGRGKNDK